MPLPDFGWAVKSFGRFAIRGPNLDYLVHMFRCIGSLGLLCALTPACVTTRLYDDGAGGAGNYIIPERDAAVDASTTTVSVSLTPLSPDLRNQLESAACADSPTNAVGTPTALAFVVDVSSSMDDKAPSTDGHTKWEITRDALQSAFNRLPQTTYVGMLLYPNQSTVANLTTTPLDPSNCVNTNAMIAVDSLGATGSSQRQALLTGLQSAMIEGATPTEDAYKYALSNDMLPVMNAVASNQSYMVLITDSEPTLLGGCIGTGQAVNPVDTKPIIAAIASASSDSGVKTFVIGLPGSEMSASTGADVRAWLSNAASAGQTPLTSDCSDTGTPNFCHTDLSQVQDLSAGLQQALQSIADQVLSCEYSMPAAPAGMTLDPNAINVVYSVNGDQSQEMLVGQTDANCSGGGGWYLSSANTIVLCADTCETVQQDPNAILRILGGCQSISIVN